MRYKIRRIRFIPKNREKYAGNPLKIRARSSWEVKMMENFDSDPNVISWISERFAVLYIHPRDNKPHRYYPDFLIKRRMPDGTIKTFMIEVKPHRETQPPKINSKRKTSSILMEQQIYDLNKAKWESAKKFCEKKGWIFSIITEKHVNFKKKKHGSKTRKVSK